MNSILRIFKNKKMVRITIDCYNILIIGINIIEFSINIVSDLGLIINLYLYPCLNFLKGSYCGFSIEFFNVKALLI